MRSHYKDIFNNQVATYTGGSQLEWREVGQLPSGRYGLRATIVDNVIFVTGGLGDGGNDLTSILSWDRSTESWHAAGDLAVERSSHAVVAVSSSIIECSAMPLT